MFLYNKKQNELPIPLYMFKTMGHNEFRQK